MVIATRHWAAIVTTFYGLVVIGLLLPLTMVLGDIPDPFSTAFSTLRSFFDNGSWAVWAWIVALLGGQALLVLLSVDATNRRLTPRRRVTLSVVTIAGAVGLLSAAAVGSVLAAIWGDDSLEYGLWVAPLSWLAWGTFFYVYRQGVSQSIERIVKRLIGGSVLELLVVVPCHVIVRQRNDCCAPTATGFAIATGIAVMLMAFGPGVYFLYRKKLEGYGRH